MDAHRIAALLIAGCAAKPLAAPTSEPLPAVFGTPERVATDGEWLAAADGRQLVIAKLDGSQPRTFPVPGAPQQLVMDHGTVFAGFGMDRSHRDAQARILVYPEQQTILEPETTRAEIASLRFVHGHLLYAYFDSKYFVRAGVAEKSGDHWTTRELGRFRMASSIDELGDGRIVIGRVYGDDINADGDAFLLEPRQLLPTTRGVRSLAAGKDEIFVADGWHREYAAKGKGLLTRIAGGKAQLVEDTPGQFTIWKLVLADLDGDGVDEVIGGGSKYLRAWKRRGDRFAGTTLVEEAADFAAAPGLVVVGGPHPQTLRWKKP